MEIKFTHEGKDYYIMPVNAKVMAEAQKVYNRAFRKAIDNGALLRKKLDDYMKEQNIWNEEKEKQYTELVKIIADIEYKLNKGGIKLSEARELAITLKKKREELRELISERSYADANTVEGQAENERFNYLVSACCMDYLTRKPVFTYDEYLENIASDLALACAKKFANYMYGLDENYEDNFVENKFLKRFKFLDDNGRLLNKDGKYVDEDGNLVDEEGYRINEKGERIDINGNPIINSTVETAEFLED